MLKNIIILTMLYCPIFADNLKEIYTIIDDDLQSSMRLYEIQDTTSAIESIKFARHHGYRNTGLEKNIIQNISKEYSTSIDKHFEKIITLMQKQKSNNEIRDEIKVVLKKVQVALPQLKTTKAASNKQDWHKVTKRVTDELNAANLLYKDGDIKQSIERVREAYFDIFEESGFEEAILNISIDRKIKAEEHFRQISNMIKAGNSISEIEQIIDEMKDDLTDLSNILNPKPNSENNFTLLLPILLLASYLGIYAIKRKK